MNKSNIYTNARRSSGLTCGMFLLTCAMIFQTANARTQQGSASPQNADKTPAVEVWIDDFDGAALDAAKWERFTFAGGGGGKVEVKNGQLRQRGVGESRAGVRSRKSWRSDRFYAEATLAKVGERVPTPGDRNTQVGFANLTILFDGSGANRLEFIMTSEGSLEAWAVTNGRGERLDNRKLATRLKNPHLGIARRGDEIYFMLNDDTGTSQPQIALQKTITDLPPTFTVMLYGFGTSENNWDKCLVQTTAQSPSNE